ncbi:hypothetical protein J6X73_01370 [Candidatus Saccharibacteria bacterium]|nr:hypothetical protein [Candidatus Saccharibacteria bacterium]
MSKRDQEFTNFDGEAKAKTIKGNWYDQHSWSPEAKRTFFRAAQGHDHAPDLGRKEMDEAMAEILVSDLYLLSLPAEARTILQCCGMAALKEEAMKLAYQFGGYNILCWYGRLPRSLRKGAISIGRGFHLVKAETGMPLREFLYFTKFLSSTTALTKADASILQEWSGMPQDRMCDFVHVLLSYLQEFLRQQHDAAAQHNAAAQHETKVMQITVIHITLG